MIQPDSAEVDQLTARLGATCRTVIDAEIRRLRRRVPQLSETQLAVLDEALWSVAERLVLARVRAAPPGPARCAAAVFAGDPR